MTAVVNLVVTLGMLVVVPLGLRLLPVAGTDRVARIFPAFGVPGVVALWVPRGVVSTTLAGWYALGTLLLVALATRYVWKCLSRKDFRSANAAALTAALVAHLVATAHPSPATTTAAWSVPGGTFVVLVGYFVNDEVELLGAVILTAGMWLVGWTLWTRARAQTGDTATRLLLGTSAVTLVATMVLALDWALGHVVDGVPHLPLAWMAWTHGLANAIGFALCALVAFTHQTRMRAAREAA